MFWSQSDLLFSLFSVSSVPGPELVDGKGCGGGGDGGWEGVVLS